MRYKNIARYTRWLAYKYGAVLRGVRRLFSLKFVFVRFGKQWMWGSPPHPLVQSVFAFAIRIVLDCLLGVPPKPSQTTPKSGL